MSKVMYEARTQPDASTLSTASNAPPTGWWSALWPHDVPRRWKPLRAHSSTAPWLIPSTLCPWCPSGTSAPMNGNATLPSVPASIAAGEYTSSRGMEFWLAVTGRGPSAADAQNTAGQWRVVIRAPIPSDAVASGADADGKRVEAGVCESTAPFSARRLAHVAGYATIGGGGFVASAGGSGEMVTPSTSGHGGAEGGAEQSQAQSPVAEASHSIQNRWPAVKK